VKVTDTASAIRHPPSDSASAVPLPVGLARVNEFLSYDAQARTATLMLVAGYNGLNDALNYNGGARGSQGVSVPVGWAVHVQMTNRDGDLQHSAIVVRQVLPPPEEMPAPAFAGALVSQLEEGVHEGDTTSFDFVAAKPGRYMIACGVPGHAQGGMWLRLSVSTDIDRPSYR
jgi:sulfocyanin